jgi:hypothetical protein
VASKTFTLFLLDGSASPPAFEVDFFEGPENARARALQVLNERTRYHAVEVFDGVESFIVERPPRPQGPID